MSDDPHEADIFAENRQLRGDAQAAWAEANRRAFTIDRLEDELAGERLRAGHRRLLRPLVFISGPYSQGDPVLNVRDAVQWAEEIERHDCDVVIPHLSMLWHLISPAPLDRWYARDLAVLARCDALVRIPGLSTGADAEVTYALERDLAVFTVEPGRESFWRVFRDWRKGVAA